MTKEENPRAIVYRIQTPRLIIRCWQPIDAPMLKRAIDESREHLKPFMPWAHGEPDSIEVQLERTHKFRGNFDLDIDYVFGILDLEEKSVLGGTGLHTRAGKDAREIGYWIHADHIGKGLATEVVKALMRVAFEIEGIKRLEIHCDPKNTASANIPKKLGYTLDEIEPRTTPDYPGQMDMKWSMDVETYTAREEVPPEIKCWNGMGTPIEGLE